MSSFRVRKSDLSMFLGATAGMFMVLAMVAMMVFLGGCSKKRTAITVLPEKVVQQPAQESVQQPDHQPAPIVIDMSGSGPVTVYFDFNDSDLKPQEAMKLDGINLEVNTIRIDANTCSWGSDDYNMGLSVRRGNQISSYIKYLGFKGHIEMIPHGENLCAARCESIDEPACEACRKAVVR